MLAGLAQEQLLYAMHNHFMKVPVIDNIPNTRSALIERCVLHESMSTSIRMIVYYSFCNDPLCWCPWTAVAMWAPLYRHMHEHVLWAPHNSKHHLVVMNLTTLGFTLLDEVGLSIGFLFAVSDPLIKDQLTFHWLLGAQ